jgi:hypothetical protein
LLLVAGGLVVPRASCLLARAAQGAGWAPFALAGAGGKPGGVSQKPPGAGLSSR